MNERELRQILELHRRWLEEEGDGQRADLRGADLRSVDLRHADLRSADLGHADLGSANLRGADLRGAHLRHADLSGADLSDADLSGANLRGANLRGADLRGANLKGAGLSGADLSDADLRWAVTQNVIGLPAIGVQIDTSRRNNMITYYPELKIVTTGCFQGTMDALKSKVEETHKHNEVLLERYRRVIAFIDGYVEAPDELS